ncbi:lysine exporter LysO family protein [Candidatus Fukatsuia symbiotica]|uniref:lysine exporter LysO family protein n=2 Tax=Yersiniaceae TaxID=1903411 RepID=UPI000934F9F2|nr:lysine exporter LysO family protein [Candidatus Fukatsuia symbiotica]
MLGSLFSIVTIGALLMLGFATGKLLKDASKKFITRQMAHFVMLLLLMMGIEFGEIFTSPRIGGSIVLHALLFSFIISVTTFFILLRKPSKAMGLKIKNTGKYFMDPVISCVKAISFFLIGVFIYYISKIKLADYNLSSAYVLYFVIYLVGIDLVSINLKKISLHHLKLPFLTIIATIISAFIFSLLTKHLFIESLALSTGYGWFSLSGAMVGNILGEDHGSLAFMVDLFREFFSIFLLYIFGSHYPHSAIGVSGAAALDSALPFVKENCDEESIKYAIVSGLILTILAPFFIFIFS